MELELCGKHRYHGTAPDECALCEIERLRHALEFYADEYRYHGPNNRLEPGDKYPDPSQRAYALDVTRDRGRIARAVLSGGIVNAG